MYHRDMSKELCWCG